MGQNETGKSAGKQLRSCTLTLLVHQRSSVQQRDWLKCWQMRLAKLWNRRSLGLTLSEELSDTWFSASSPVLLEVFQTSKQKDLHKVI